MMAAGYTARSRAYAQAMYRAGIGLDNVILFGDECRDTVVEAVTPKSTDLPVFMPNLSIPLRETCRSADWPVTEIGAGNINSEEMIGVLSNLKPDLLIYSGYGGQLIHPSVIDLAIPILHMHAGWLPDYRGSTTIYYSWLQEQRCGVSAILIDSGIDTGPVVMRRHYPMAPDHVDVDRIYDSALRADVLVSVLKHYSETGKLPSEEVEDDGDTYYVIHPVLKHISRLQPRSKP